MVSGQPLLSRAPQKAADLVLLLHSCWRLSHLCLSESPSVRCSPPPLTKHPWGGSFGLCHMIENHMTHLSLITMSISRRQHWDTVDFSGRFRKLETGRWYLRQMSSDWIWNISTRKSPSCPPWDSPSLLVCLPPGLPLLYWEALHQHTDSENKIFIW